MASDGMYEHDTVRRRYMIAKQQSQEFELQAASNRRSHGPTVVRPEDTSSCRHNIVVATLHPIMLPLED